MSHITIEDATQRPQNSSAFLPALDESHLRSAAPAAFATAAHPKLGPKYTFIPTQQVLAGLREAGFVPVRAYQPVRFMNPACHGQHMIRLRRLAESVQLKDSIPEIVFLNSHDGSSAYRMQMGLYRCVCSNGLIVSMGSMPGVYVAHRGDVVDRVIEGASQLANRFGTLAQQVIRMEHRSMLKDEQLQFAESALALRYPDLAQAGMAASSLLNCRRQSDVASDLWTVFNRVQENLIAGGVRRVASNGRLMRTRAIRAIGRNVRLNAALWDLAAAYVA